MVEATCRKRVWGNFRDFWRRCSWYREDERVCHSDDGGDGGGDDDDDEEEEEEEDDDDDEEDDDSNGCNDIMERVKM